MSGKTKGARSVWVSAIEVEEEPLEEWMFCETPERAKELELSIYSDRATGRVYNFLLIPFATDDEVGTLPRPADTVH